MNPFAITAIAIFAVTFAGWILAVLAFAGGVRAAEWFWKAIKEGRF